MRESPWGLGGPTPRRRADIDPEPTDPDRTFATVLASIRRAVRQRGSGVSARVLVLGTFGTSAVAQRVESVLARRGRATHAVAVDDRGDRRSPAGVETLVVEAGGESAAIRDARELLGPPDVVVVTAVGRADLERLGPGRGDVVRSVAAAIPADATVVNAEGSPAVRRYLETAVRRRGATIEHVGEHDASAPGAELAAAIDGALAALGEAPLPEEEREALVAASHPDWLELPEGRLYDALGVSDTVAIERLRAALVTDREPVSLVAVLPPGRRDVAAAVAEYVTRHHRRGLLDRLHAVGSLAPLVADRCGAPAVAHEGISSTGHGGPSATLRDAGSAGDTVAPADLLAAALADGPALVVGSAEAPAGAALSEGITERIERSGAARVG